MNGNHFKYANITCIILSFLIFSQVFIWSLLNKTSLVNSKSNIITIICLLIVFFTFMFKKILYQNNLRLSIYLLFKFYLIFFIIYVLFNSYYSNNLFIGIPYGHFGDFFHLINLSSQNNYTEISNIGYLPGILLVTEIFTYLFAFNSQNLIKINTWAIIFYSLIFIFGVFLSCYLFFKSNQRKLFNLMFIYLTSYPFLIEFERGNLVIFSLYAFSLLVYLLHENKNISLILSIFLSFKAINFIFFPIVFFYRKFEIYKFLLYSMLIIGVIPSILFYLSNSLIDYSNLFKNLITVAHFPDNHIAVAHSGLFSNLVFFQNSGFFHNIDRSLFINYSLLLCLIILIGYAIISFYKYFKGTFYKKDLFYSMLFIFILLKLFHHNNADMNLILTFPLFSVLLLFNQSFVEKVIISLLFILFFPFYSFLLFEIKDTATFVSFYFSLRTLVFSSLYILIIIFLFLRFTKFNKFGSI